MSPSQAKAVDAKICFIYQLREMEHITGLIKFQTRSKVKCLKRYFACISFDYDQICVEQQGNSHSKNSTWIKQDLKFCLSL
jgi:hypothetical protein